MNKSDLIVLNQINIVVFIFNWISIQLNYSLKRLSQRIPHGFGYMTEYITSAAICEALLDTVGKKTRMAL